MSITVTAYFEICDSVLYGGEGSKIYTKLDVECEIEEVNKEFEEVIEEFRKNLADSCSVDEKKVRLVKRTDALEHKKTETDNRGNLEVCGFSWDNLGEGHVITKEECVKLYGCLSKLMDYESTGLSPHQVEILVSESKN